jgi:hypothetical protein
MKWSIFPFATSAIPLCLHTFVSTYNTTRGRLITECKWRHGGKTNHGKYNGSGFSLLDFDVADEVFANIAMPEVQVKQSEKPASTIPPLILEG